MIFALCDSVNEKLDSSCAYAESLTEIATAIRDIPEHKRVVVSVRNSENAKEQLLNITKAWLEDDEPEVWDYPITASLIALADSGRDADAISLSRDLSRDPSLEIASGMADSYLLQKALE